MAAAKMARAPLDGFRVADFTWVWAGPYCTLQLAHLGAEVIRVESSTRLCATRGIVPMADGQSGPDRCGLFNQYNQGKRSLTLNLRTPQGLSAARRLALCSDVVANNFAAGVMDRLGLGYEELRKQKPDLIMISMTGYGDTGPYKGDVAYGPALVPLSGLTSLTGYRDGPPQGVGFSYSDPNGGVHGAFAVLAALYHRARTGEGQYIDLSQWEASVPLTSEGVLDYSMNRRQPPRAGNRDAQMAPHGVFRCKNMAEKVADREIDMWVAIAAADDAEWRRLAGVIGGSELAADPRFATLVERKRNEDPLEVVISQWTAQRFAAEAVATLQAAGVAAAVVATNKDVYDDPHLSARGFFVELEHAAVGVRRHTGVPWRSQRVPTVVRKPAPMLGQDNEAVLREVLGYSAEEVEAMREAGALD